MQSGKGGGAGVGSPESESGLCHQPDLHPEPPLLAHPQRGILPVSHTAPKRSRKRRDTQGLSEPQALDRCWLMPFVVMTRDKAGVSTRAKQALNRFQVPLPEQT